MPNADDRALFFNTIEQITMSLLEGRTVSSERDVQLLLLRLGEVGFEEGDKTNPTKDWRIALEMAMSVLVQCVSHGACSADKLSRMLSDEVEAGAAGGEPAYKSAFDHWPELPRILVRAIDVLRPPTGTPPRATAKAAFNVAFDVLDHIVRSDERPANKVSLWKSICDISTSDAEASEKNSATCDRTHGIRSGKRPVADPCAKEKGSQEQSNAGKELACKWAVETELSVAKSSAIFDTLRVVRTLSNAVLDGDVSQAALTSSALLSNTIAKAYLAQCEGTQKCAGTPITSAQVQKTFALLGAMVSYASTYRDDKPTGDSTKDNTLAKQRADELVFSVGVGVGGGFQWASGREGGEDNIVAPFVALPVGFAADVLPGGWSATSLLGLHFQLSALDVAQYAAIDNKGATPTPDAGTAVFLGGAAGVLLGTPSVSFLVGVNGGYAPTLHWTDNARGNGAGRLGLFAGTYIPFFDFN
jgi:hypothetical protein